MLTCEICGKQTTLLCTEANQQPALHFKAKAQGICLECKHKLGFKSLREFDNEIKQMQEK